MADLFFNSFHEYKGDGTIDMDGHTFKIMLLSDAYTPNAATQTVKADIVANELANGNGYTTGGLTLTNPTWNSSGGITTFDADDAVWTTASITARYAVIYDDTPTSPADPLMVLLDFGQNVTSTNNDFSIQFDAAGIFRTGTKGVV